MDWKDVYVHCFKRKLVMDVFLRLWMYVLLMNPVAGGARYTCPSMCLCAMDRNQVLNVDCTARNLTALPEDLDVNTVNLDLSINNIIVLPDRAFSRLRRLHTLHLVTNALTSLPTNVFSKSNTLVQLSLQGNKFRYVPRRALRNLVSLKRLYLDNNLISKVHENSFRTLRGLVQLNLDNNRLTEVPIAALNQARGLAAIDLSNNLIEVIPDNAFANLTDLFVLMLSNNRISYISDKAFLGLPVLSILELNQNRLKEMPAAIGYLPDLVDLTIAENVIDHLPDGCFHGNKKLARLHLKDNPITTIGRSTFSDLPSLEVLELSEARDVTVFPDLRGTYRLTKITLDRASISVLPDDLCTHGSQLTVLDVHYNEISAIPNMSDCTQMIMLNLANNDIKWIEDGAINGLINLKDLVLANNKIRYISDVAFANLARLEYLDLSHNQIEYIHPGAFEGLIKLTDLNVGENRFPELPTKGLQNLRHLKTFHNQELLEPPPYEALPNIMTMALAYAYHCCAFIKQDIGSFEEAPSIFNQQIIWLTNNTTEFWPADDYVYPMDYDYDPLLGKYYNGTGLAGEYPGNNTHELPSIPILNDDIIKAKPPVDCRPMPGPFLPCDDLFGWWSLRCGVWIVFLLAVLGNGAVLFVSVTSKSKMDVTRFLICNLAFSDLCMGIYLGFLAIVDASTLGEFEKYAVRWQSSPGCLVAGFLGVLSSELSVFTLVVITVERFYAISHAMQLDKRLTLRHAVALMACGWVICLSIAGLPLFEVSDYRKFAICLPFETENNVSLGYVCFIMIFNALSFLIIVICYICMFISIRGSHSWNTNDTVVAKRMALLVFTDFFCWAPIIFFSITAAFEVNFASISLDEAKVLTIFVLPLNSCANPFLYAFFTRQFKRDCVKLCKRIEEASMSRHFASSGVRRASNSSNRQSQSNVMFNVKRNSCEHSLRDPGNSADITNNNSDSDLNVQAIHLTEADEQILKYVRADSGIGSKSLPLSDTSPESDPEKSLMTTALLSPKVRMRKCRPRDEILQECDSEPNIVLHTAEGQVYLNAKTTSNHALKHKETLKSKDRNQCGKRICNYTKSNINSFSSVGKRNSFDQIAALPADEDKDRNSADGPTLKSSAYDMSKYARRQLLKQRFEADRSLELGLKVDHFKNRRQKQCKTIEEDSMKSRNISTQTDANVQLRKLQKPELPADIDKRDRNKHINEWRKTSHLSFLWRNSNSFDVVTQKQKSNSLVELTRPVYDWKGNPSKRHSLTSRHEGYILLKNTSRDSAYEDDDLYEFPEDRSVYVPHTFLKGSVNTKLYSVIPEVRPRKHQQNTPIDDRDYSVDSDEVCEMSILLPAARATDSPLILKDKNSYDDNESGISSST